VCQLLISYLLVKINPVFVAFIDHAVCSKSCGGIFLASRSNGISFPPIEMPLDEQGMKRGE
jgi:hypothetical protein